MAQYAAKRWCFTLNNPGEADQFWEGHEDLFEYLVVQIEEAPETHTPHFQGFLILKTKQKLNWLKRHLHPTAHFEVTRGTNQQASDYCEKDESHPAGGFRFKLGSLPERAKAPKRNEILEEAAETIEQLKDIYIPPKKINAFALMCPGFMQAYKGITADILGPYRKDLMIITLVGPPGTGKSYSIQKFFPEHGRCIVGNSGIWFQNPTAPVMFFEEFTGQIQLQRMLQFLDPYPLALEVKGGMAPAMYNTVVITSNTTPQYWYKPGEGDGDKKMDAIHALWDRIGFTDGSYIPVRKCGHYIPSPSLDSFFGQPAINYVEATREYFWRELHNITGLDPVEDED